MPNIPVDIKTEWTKRLRDGRPQITADLHTDKGQCCLGVLCEVLADKGVLAVEKNVYDLDEGNYKTIYVYGEGGDRDSTVLPDSVAFRFGFEEPEGDIPGRPVKVVHDGREKESNNLAQLNDWGMSFEAIADLIDERL